MKRLTIFILVTLISHVAPPVSAHTAGQPAYFQINGKYANYYSIASTSLSSFPLPQDAAPDRYRVGQPLSFHLDLKSLGMPQVMIDRIKFTWDFGDGATGSGVSMTHTYTKIGSYILYVYSDDGSSPKPELSESVMLHILPLDEYELPQAIPLINGKRSKDPVSDVIRIPFTSEVQFDGTTSTGGTAEVTSYEWDLGDGTHTTESKTIHTYPADLRIAFPFLRVKDANGFISDQYVEIDNTAAGGGVNADTTKNAESLSNRLSSYMYAGAGIVVVAILWVGWWLKKRR